MTLVWNELRPQDRYRVHIVQPLSLFQIKTLTQLYQPLMGSISYALYVTLASEVDGLHHYSIERNHQWLMNMMNAPLDKLFHSRIRLEALGLVKTYRVTKEDYYTFIEYELLPPLTPKEFFGDDILSIYLYNQIGTMRYKELRAQYHAYLYGEGESEKTEITKEFHEVFHSVHPSELMALRGTESDQELQQMEIEYPLPSEPSDLPISPSYARYPIDLDSLRGFLMKGINSEVLLTDEVVLELKKISFFYGLDEWNVSRLIHDSLTVEEEIDLIQLRQKAKEAYRTQHGGKPPKLIHMVQPMAKRMFHLESTQLSEEEKHLQRLENLSPLELLEAYQGGGKVAEADLKLLEELLYDYELLPGVVNLLIEYILLTNDYKLPKNLVTKVAAHWKRLNITTVKQAQDLAKKEHQQYKEWKSKSAEEKGVKNSNKKVPQKNAVRKDKLPSWIEEQKKKEEYDHKPEDNLEKVQSQSISDHQKRERIESLLKALGEWDEGGQ
ncbi:replication initiation and membrane attachment family protein [Caldalkalibacillus mannanilyticus]|uniref:replication initiation and membrane attachment family protein n=1 Tax=Caldalkalibacillus mannanilyticus TaxID=1418 RepID=UPI00046AE9CF|nr:DnaD domain protein [Caldalkalibacillus mannanilyticus]